MFTDLFTDSKIQAPIAAAFLALLGVVLTSVITLMNARKSSNSTIIAAEKAKEAAQHSASAAHRMAELKSQEIQYDKAKFRLDAFKKRSDEIRELAAEFYSLLFHPGRILLTSENVKELARLDAAIRLRIVPVNHEDSLANPRFGEQYNILMQNIMLAVEGEIEENIKSFRWDFLTQTQQIVWQITNQIAREIHAVTDPAK
jgi:gas vesicle protein